MSRKKAIILCNLGTPASATPAGVRAFLRPFLSDQRVVELPRLLWWPILYGIILPIRSQRVAKAYESIWTERGSPLLSITEDQRDKLQAKLSADTQCRDIRIEIAMSYSKPGLGDTLSQLSQEGCDDVFILPLYPQFSATTTASIFDQLAKWSAAQRNLPSIHLLKDYHDHPLYIAALKRSVEDLWVQSGESNHLLMSFHGIPQRNVDEGDPYQLQCEKTAQLLAEALGLSSDHYTTAYQSRFGKQEWIKPYTSDVLKGLAEQGKSVDVICPAFAADCLETLEEISVEERDEFLANGGKQFRYIGCLNDDENHINLLFELIRKFSLN